MRPEYLPTRWETPPCPFCGSAERLFVERYGYRLRFTHARCAGCGLLYQCPRPRYDEDFIRAAYADYFTASEGFRIGDATGSSTYDEWVEELEEIARHDRLRTAIVDVGCNMGNFLHAALRHYPRAFGTELSERQAAFVEEHVGVPVFVGQFDRWETGERFSCVHMSHVIEHVPDPVAWLRKARELLAAGGVLVLNVPNGDSLDRRWKRALQRARLRRGGWKEAWRTPDHLFEPTIPSLLRCLREQGFEVIDHYTYSRRDPTARSAWSRLYQRRLRQGSNLRVYARRAPPHPGPLPR
jgi:SAM-dependent methyltransferase